MILRGVTGRTNRDDWNWGSVNSISYKSVKTSSVNPSTVSSISYGSVKKSPVNPPTVTQTPFRLPPNHSTPKVTHKQICLPPSPPSTPSVHRNNLVDSAINGKSTIFTKQKTSKSSPAKGNEVVNSISYGSVKKSPVNPPSVTQTPLRLPPTPPPKVTPKPICLPPPSPPVRGEKPVDSAVDGKRTIIAEQETIKSSQEKGYKGNSSFLEGTTISEGLTHLLLSRPYLYPPFPVQNDPIPVVVEDTKRLISTGSRPSSSELFPSPSPSKRDTTNLPKKKKSVQVQRGKTPTFAKNEDKQNLVQLPSFPQSLLPATNSPQSSPKLPPFRDESSSPQINPVWLGSSQSLLLPATNSPQSSPIHATTISR
ncbi:hypothetical protein NE237_007711 [Protea cynaroides]|uniref:Uncharacterized protein n=1 Tax=Protea cynaroides TaxID=273540 RepID=A0A9Q0KPX7_9MAGN|nr:hypothetical protein NE237_007711 [Protea cynaroides]